MGGGGLDGHDAGPVAPRFHRLPGCVHRWFQGSLLIIDAGGELRELSGAAAPVWFALEEEASAAELAVSPRLLALVQPPSEGAVAETLDRLAAAGLVAAR